MDTKGFLRRLTYGPSITVINTPCCGIPTGLPCPDHFARLPAFELIRQKSVAILKTVLAMQKDAGIPGHVIEQEIIPRFRRQSDTLKAMERKLEDVGEGIRRALDITERIRAYSKMQDFQRGDERVDLRQLLLQYGEIYGQRISELQIGYKVTCLTDDPSITGSASQMDTVLRNLVLNALDAVEEEEGKAREVEAILSSEEKSGVAYLRIHVKDTGPGIPADKMEEIFDPFYSAHLSPPASLSFSRLVILAHQNGDDFPVPFDFPCGRLFDDFVNYLSG